MTLKDIRENGSTRPVTKLDHADEFQRQLALIPLDQQAAMIAKINQRLDSLIASPRPNWGSIMNTSIEGGKASPLTGVRGDWAGTPFEPIYFLACNQSETQSALFYGNLWKMVIIGRPEP